MQQRDAAFYSWSARNGSGDGSCGVTSDPGRAVTLLLTALQKLAPGASGRVAIVRLERHVWPPSYLYGAPLVVNRRRVTDG
ncbi:hypothetical protein AB0C27_40435 [Nonomuraea sp. NPDC048882]|uniref:hypothetical protein n=1 Tax=Nonomuraea sp. NPDC048882 TaxID=3154347 RepID=UPI0033C0A797